MTVYNLSGAARMLQATDQALARIRGQFAGKIPHTARDTCRLIEQHITAARGAIDKAIRQAADIVGDARIYPAGKAQLLGKLVADTEAELARHAERARAAADVLTAELTQAALPKMSGSRDAAQLARQDALMILDRTPPERRDAAIRRLAARSDDVGALVNSPWLDDYLTAVGGERTAQAMRVLATEAALEAARQSGDPVRAAAAEAISHAGQYGAAVTGVQAAWRHVAEELTGEGAAERLAAIDAASRRIEPTAA
jgi:hypothetical protein